MEIFASHIGEGVDLCYQTFVSRTLRNIVRWRQRGAVPCTKVEIIGGKPRWKRGEGSKGNQGGIDDEDDDIDGRIEEEKMRRSRPALDILEIAPSVVARRSTRRVNRRGAVFFFFRKMRFRQELGDDAKNCCGGRENGLSSLIGLPNGEIWRTSAFAISLPARRHFHIFEIAGLIRFRRRTRLTPSRRFYRMTARFVGNYSRYRVTFTCTYSNVVNFFMLTLILINWWSDSECSTVQIIVQFLKFER